MGSKNSKPEGQVHKASDSSKKEQQPIDSVNEWQKKENHAHDKKVKAMNELPVIYVGAGDKQVNVPAGGAQIVFKGDPSTEVKMEPVKEPEPEQQANRVRVIHTGAYAGGGVVYSVPKETVSADGNTKVVVVSRPRSCYYYDPWYGPCYYGYYPYGYHGYRYPRYYYY